MEKLFRLSVIITIFFTVLFFFAWIFEVNSYRLDRCVYYSVSTTVCLFGINLLFGFREER